MRCRYSPELTFSGILGALRCMHPDRSAPSAPQTRSVRAAWWTELMVDELLNRI
jgi:hypothetical protein